MTANANLATMSRRSFVASAAAAGLAVAASATAADIARADAPAAVLTPGVYTATVASIKGKMDVTVAVSEKAIQSVTARTEDTKHIVAHVLQQLVPAIVENQSTEVDTVTGATFTSFALLSGVRECLAQAGASEADFAADCTAVQVQADAETFDVAVVGSGAAGLSTAIQCAKAGLRTVVLERNGYFGGTTSVSSGGVWTSSTLFNEATGYNFTPDSLVQHLYDCSHAEEGTLNEALIKKIAEVSGPIYTEYHEAGAPWDTQRYTFGDPLAEMPVSWPEMFYDNGFENSGGMTLIDFMVRHAYEVGVDLRTYAKVDGLLVDGDAVVGVHVDGRAKAYDVNARAVVLATGGFQQNLSLVEELAPEHATLVPFTGAGSRGDAIVWGRELGAAIAGNGVAGSLGLNAALGYCGIPGATTYCTMLRVNKDGVRFMNEAGHYSTFPAALCSQPDGVCWGIVDSANAAIANVEDLVERGCAVTAETLEELAETIGVPTDAMVATVAAYNDLAAAGEDDPEFGLPAAAMTPALEAPFYAIEIHMVSFACLTGLAADENCQIAREDGSVIEGLYGAGEAIIGNICSGTYAGSGTMIGSGIYEGKIIADALA